MRPIDADELLYMLTSEWNSLQKENDIYYQGKMDAYREAIETIYHASTVGGWVSVKDRLPEKNDEYIVYIKTGSVSFCWYDGEDWIAYDGSPWAREYVTHWMPMPKPPKEVSGDD